MVELQFSDYLYPRGSKKTKTKPTYERKWIERLKTIKESKWGPLVNLC